MNAVSRLELAVTPAWDRADPAQEDAGAYTHDFRDDWRPLLESLLRDVAGTARMRFGEDANKESDA